MNKQMQLVIGLVVAAILIFGIISQTAHYKTSDARAIGDEFVTAIHANDYDKAYGLLHKNLKGKLPKDAFEAMLKQYNVSSISSVTWKEEAVEKNGVHTVKGLGSDNDMQVTIQATDIQNDGKTGILLYGFIPQKNAPAPAPAPAPASEKKPEANKKPATDKKSKEKKGE